MYQYADGYHHREDVPQAESKAQMHYFVLLFNFRSWDGIPEENFNLQSGPLTLAGILFLQHTRDQIF